MFTNKSIFIPLVLTVSLILSSCAAGVANATQPTKPAEPSVIPTTQSQEPAPLAEVTSVEIQSENAAPGQVNVVVSGNLNEACAKLGDTQITYNAQTFMILLFVVSPTDHGCVPIVTPFMQTIPLDISQLGAGDYTVKVNGVSAVFSLPAGPSQEPGTSTPIEPGQVETYSSDLYHFQFSIPAGWNAAVDKNIPAGAGTDPEYISLTSGDSSSLPRMGVEVLTGTPPSTGFENCEKNLIFRTLPACKISLPAGQNPAEEMLIFQNGSAYYFITLTYDDPASLQLFDELLSSFEFTR